MYARSNAGVAAESSAYLYCVAGHSSNLSRSPAPDREETGTNEHDSCALVLVPKAPHAPTHCNWHALEIQNRVTDDSELSLQLNIVARRYAFRIPLHPSFLCWLYQGATQTPSNNPV